MEYKQIEWCDSKTKKQCYVYWKTPEEWGNLIYRYIMDNGMTNTVCTFFELTEGDDVQKQGNYNFKTKIAVFENCNFSVTEFAGLDQSLLLKALKVLEISKKAEVIKFGGNEGVKFF